MTSEIMINPKTPAFRKFKNHLRSMSQNPNISQLGIQHFNVPLEDFCQSATQMKVEEFVKCTELQAGISRKTDETLISTMFGSGIFSLVGMLYCLEEGSIKSTFGMVLAVPCMLTFFVSLIAYESLQVSYRWKAPKYLQAAWKLEKITKRLLKDSSEILFFQEYSSHYQKLAKVIKENSMFCIYPRPKQVKKELAGNKDYLVQACFLQSMESLAQTIPKWTKEKKASKFTSSFKNIDNIYKNQIKCSMDLWLHLCFPDFRKGGKKTWSLLLLHNTLYCNEEPPRPLLKDPYRKQVIQAHDFAFSMLNI